jgi:hypothetical protein
LQIVLLDIAELSGALSIGHDSTTYLSRRLALYVEGLRYLLTKQFKTCVKNPQI